MQKIKIYKGHEISIDTKDGKFYATINGALKKFPSVKSAENMIDKTAIIDFKPVEVLFIEEEWYNPCTYSIKQVKLVSYLERKGYRTNSLLNHTRALHQKQRFSIFSL